MVRTLMIGTALILIGCQAPRLRQRDAAQHSGAIAAPQPIAVGPGAPIPVAPGPSAGAAPFPVAPQNPALPPTVTPSGPTPFPTAPPGPNTGANGKIEANWQPAEARSALENRVLLSPPEPIPGDGKETQKKLYPPQVDAKESMTALPAGIAQFAQVTPKISTGLRPSADDGLDWLQAKKYRTVVRLRLPGEDDAADRKEVEKRGFTYVGLEVSPNLITKETVDEFFQTLRDPERQPVFVYDRDGSLAGGLWYLWLRLIEEAPDDVARIRARSLGLREDREGAHRDMWQGVQRFLAEAKNR